MIYQKYKKDCKHIFIILAEMLFSKKKLIGDCSSLSRYTNLLGSEFKKINFLSDPWSIYLW